MVLQMPIRILQLIAISMLLMVSCKSDQLILPDIDNSAVDFQFIEFDKLLFDMDTTNLDSGLAKLNESYPAFSKLFFETILPIKDEEGNISTEILHEFLSDSSLVELKNDVDQAVDKRNLKSAFEEAYKYVRHYFPNLKPPNIYTLISGFAYQRFLFEDEEGDALGVGLDFFLGEDYPYKKIDPKNPSFSAYQTRTFNKDHIVKKALELWVEDKITPPLKNNLVSYMITNGKKLYILDQILPTVSDTVIMEYSKQQLEWADENQLQVWSYFFEQELFYETNLRKLNKYINPSPNSPGMPAEAPGRIANYMGWRIVETYMDRYPDKSLEMLLMETDAQKILDLSKYKPRKS